MQVTRSFFIKTGTTLVIFVIIAMPVNVNLNTNIDINKDNEVFVHPRYLPQKNNEPYILDHTEPRIIGVASYYAHRFNKRITANGEVFNMYSLTAAHRTLPFNTLLRITNLRNNKIIYVRINDRGPYIKGREIDLSYGAARKLDMIYQGLEKVGIIVLGTVHEKADVKNVQKELDLYL